MSWITILVLSPLFLNFLYDVTFYLPSWILSSYSSLSLGLILATILPGVVLFLGTIKKQASLYGNFELLEKKSTPDFSKTMVVIPLICFYLFLSMYYFTFVDLDFSDFFNRMPTFYKKSKVGFAWVFYLYKICIYTQIYILYKKGPSTKRLVSCALSILLFGLTGGRSLVLLLTLAVFVISTIVYGVKISRKKMLSAGFILILFFSVVSITRSGGSFKHYFSGNAVGMDFNNTKALSDSLSYVKNNDDFYFLSMEDFFYSLVPRSLYPEKPTSSAETRKVYKEISESGRTTNITFGYYGNLLLNFGYSGFIISFLVLILLYKKYLKLINNIQSINIKNFLMIILFSHYGLVLRGGIINSRVFLLFITVFIAVAYVEIQKVRVVKNG